MKELRAAIPPEEWFRQFCHDARDLVIEAEIHVCNPSCWKYHSKGANHICRHGSYHVVTLVDDDMNEVTRRRRGKALRGCIAIVRDTRFGMAGRILTYQLHPGESPTNYAALCTMRCNVDVQDLRRVLPPVLWLEPHELEPEGIETAGRSYTHGAYPQRLKQYSMPDLGANWGWMQYLGNSPCHLDAVDPELDWLGVFQSLTDIPRADAEEFQELAKPLKREIIASFVDAHNAGYYINSYTTKVNPTMDNVLRRLFDAVRALHDAWNQAPQRDGEKGKASKSSSTYAKTLQLLNRCETAVRKASFKSGCELVFVILFRHMTFATHGCWQVFMGKAIYFAYEAWRIKYGQMPTQDVPRSDSQLLFQLPEITDHLLEGWRQEQRDGNIAFIGPDGREVNPAGYVRSYRRITSKATGASQKSLDAIALLRRAVSAQEEDIKRSQKSSDATCKSKAVKDFLK